MSQPSPFDMFLGAIRLVVREEIAAAVKTQAKPKLLVDTEQAAAMLDVPSTWLAEAARSGRVPSVRLGHYVKFKVADLEAFIAADRGERKKAM